MTTPAPYLEALELEERTTLWKPFFGSLTMHLVLFGMTLGYSWMLAPNIVQFGNPNAVPGGAVPINITPQIPLAAAQTVFENPVAANTRSAVPPPPLGQEREQEKVEMAEEAAIPLPGKATKQEERAPVRRFRPYVPDRDNQLYSMKGMGVNTPSYTGAQSDAFGVGIGPGTGSPFGTRFGWYAEALQRRLGEQWQKELALVDRGVSANARTMVSFEILRDGTLRGIRLAESSGASALDYAALRAVTNASPVPPLPPELGKSSVSIEIWFQLKR